ncbi:MAG: maltotransferase domain-containing protein [Microthrixaceae bacterium]
MTGAEVIPRDRVPRAVVEVRSPVVDCGSFAAKASLGAPTTVVADVFCDGHDAVAAALLYRHESDPDWLETPMRALGNDLHVGRFLPDRPGLWSFAVSGWVDHFSTALDGIRKKVDADVDVEVELLELRNMLLEMHSAADGDDAVLVAELASALRTATTRSSSPSQVLQRWRSAPSRVGRPRPRGPTRSSPTAKRPIQCLVRAVPRSLGEPDAHGTLRRRGPAPPGGLDGVRRPLPAPIHPIGTTARKGPDNSTECSPGDPGSPWAIGAEGGHRAVHPQLGTPADVERLAAACSGHGIDLALDLAFQCSPDHPWVSEHPEWFARRADGSIQYAENPPRSTRTSTPRLRVEDWESLWQALHGSSGTGRTWVCVFRVDNPTRSRSGSGSGCSRRSGAATPTWCSSPRRSASQGDGRLARSASSSPTPTSPGAPEPTRSVSTSPT